MKIESSLSALNSLGSAQSALKGNFERLSSGSRINSAKDDAAGLAIAVSLLTQQGGQAQAIRNVGDGLSLAGTADSALGQASESLQRIRELTVQAANGTNSDGDKAAIQTEISQLSEGLNQLTQNTEFNGQKLFDGNFKADIQSGDKVGDIQSLQLADASASALGLTTLDVSTQAGSTAALDSLDSALAQVSSQRSQVGAFESRLNSSLASLTGSYENLAAARSRITDADFGKETSDLAQNTVREQAALKVVGAYQESQKSVLSLLRS